MGGSHYRAERQTGRRRGGKTWKTREPEEKDTINTEEDERERGGRGGLGRKQRDRCRFIFFRS